MDMIRLNKKDLEDLRNLLIYLKENGMQVEDLNNMIYYLGKKYEFDPFKYEINLLTGIVSERKSNFNPFEQVTTQAKQQTPVIMESPVKVISEEESKPKKPNITVEKLESGARLYRLNQKVEGLPKRPTKSDHLNEFKRWIQKNKLDLITVRKMISMIEQYKRHEEVSPNEFIEKPEEIIELQEWIESRDLDYLKLRMMLAIIAQQEANLNREAVVAR